MQWVNITKSLTSFGLNSKTKNIHEEKDITDLYLFPDLTVYTNVIFLVTCSCNGEIIRLMLSMSYISYQISRTLM